MIVSYPLLCYSARMSKKSAYSIAGVYTITNSVTGSVYVGQSVNIRKRWEVHRSTLAAGKHRNCYLQRAWAKYGAGAFVFAVHTDLSHLPRDGIKPALDAKEIDVLSVTPDTYNLMEAGLSGTLATPETRAIWSRQRKAMWSNPEFRRRRSEATKALYADPEWKARRDEAVKLGLSTPEARQAASEKFKRIWSSEAHQAQQSEKRKANWQNPEYRAKQTRSRSLAWADPEAKAARGKAVGIGQKAAWADPEIRARRIAAIRAAAARRRKTITRASEPHPNAPAPPCSVPRSTP